MRVPGWIFSGACSHCGIQSGCSRSCAMRRSGARLSVGLSAGIAPSTWHDWHFSSSNSSLPGPASSVICRSSYVRNMPMEFAVAPKYRITPFRRASSKPNVGMRTFSHGRMVIGPWMNAYSQSGCTLAPSGVSSGGASDASPTTFLYSPPSPSISWQPTQFWRRTSARPDTM